MNGLLERTIHEDGTHPFSGAAIRTYHKLDGTDNRNAFSLISAGWKSKIKMPAGLVLFDHHEKELVPGLSPSCWWPQALLDLELGLLESLLCTCLHPNFPL